MIKLNLITLILEVIMNVLNFINKSDVDEDYFNPDFIFTIRQFKNYIIKNHSKIVPINPHTAYVRDGDFSGLLSDMNVEKKYHILISILNGIDANSDYNQTTLTIIIPDISFIHILLSLFKSVYS